MYPSPSQVDQFLQNTKIWTSFILGCHFRLLLKFGRKVCLFRKRISFSPLKPFCISPDWLITQGFHFSVSLTFHINDHLLPDGKVMMVSSEVCLGRAAHSPRGCLGKNRPLSVFSKINYFGMNVPVSLQVAKCQSAENNLSS